MFSSRLLKIEFTRSFLIGVFARLIFMGSSYAAPRSEDLSSIPVVFLIKSRTSIHEVARQVNDPHSSRFGKPFSPEEIALQVSPASDDYFGLIARLKKRGFKLVHQDKIHQYLITESTSKVLQSTFRIKFEHASDGKYFATSAPIIPSDLSMIDSIVNLDSRVQLKPHKNESLAPSEALRQVATDFPAGLKPNEINKFYGFDEIHEEGFFGEGEKIATVAFNAVSKNNVAVFLNTFGIANNADIEIVSVMDGHPAKSECSSALDCENQVENDLDLEMAARIAPKATLISFVGTTDNYLASWVAIFTTILDRGDIFIINNSDDANVNPLGNDVGSCEANLKGSAFISELEPLFDRAVAQGVTIFSASGDNGSDNCGRGRSSLGRKGPNIVSVGGTDRIRSGNETAWQKSGGGFSVIYPAPEWQLVATHGAAMRGVPDIAFYASDSQGNSLTLFPGGLAEKPRDGWDMLERVSVLLPWRDFWRW